MMFERFFIDFILCLIIYKLLELLNFFVILRSISRGDASEHLTNPKKAVRAVL